MRLEEAYSILGLPVPVDGRRLSDDETRKAYKSKALQYHPDKNKSPDANQQFLKVTAAYERISNPAPDDNRGNSNTSSSSGGTVTWMRGVKITRYSDGLREEMSTTKAGVENTNIFLNSTLIAVVKKTKRSITVENKGGCYEMKAQMPILYGMTIGPRGIISPDGSGGESAASFKARQQADERARTAAASLVSKLSDFLNAFRTPASGGGAATATASGSGSGSGSGSSGGARQSTVEQDNRDFLKAACEGNLNRVESLFRSQSGIDKNGQEHRGYTAVYFAASNGHLRVVKFLVEEAKVDIDIADGGGQTPLWTAINHGRDDVALYLIEKGANIHKANGKRYAPLLVAAESGRDVVAKALIAKGADLNFSSKWGQTPLFIAVQRNHMRVVQTMVDSGVDVNKFDCEGMTPLHAAVERGFVDIAVYLMETGKADLRARTNEILTKVGRKIVGRRPGYLPMELAEKCNRPEAMKQAILNEETRRREGSGVQGDGEQPAGKKQRLV